MFHTKNLWLIGLFGILVACSEFKPESNKIHTYRIPWSNQNGQLVFADVTLDDLKDPYYMDGASARVIVSGDYYNYSGPMGETAKPNMIRSDGVLVPSDVKSIAAVSAYAHMNRLRKLDTELGVLHLLKWPRKVGVNTLIEVSNNLYAANNAFYSPTNDTMNILPYAENGNPFYINGAVLAHEHFHALYHSQVHWMKVLSSSEMMGKMGNNEFIEICEDDKFYSKVKKNWEMGIVDYDDYVKQWVNEKNGINFVSVKKLMQQANYVISRSWDEGGADVYAYLYSRNDNFLKDSLDHGDYRKISGKYKSYYRNASEIVSNLKLINNFRCNMSMQNYIPLKSIGFDHESKYFYLMASDYAKFFKKLADSKVLRKKYGHQSQKKVVLALINNFKAIGTYLKSNFHESFMSPLTPIDLVLKKLKINNEPEICQMVKEFYGEPYCANDSKGGLREI